MQDWPANSSYDVPSFGSIMLTVVLPLSGEGVLVCHRLSSSTHSLFLGGWDKLKTSKSGMNFYCE